MGVTVRVASQLRGLTKGQRDVVFEGETVFDVLDGLDAAYPGFAPRLFDESGDLHPFVSIFVAEDDARVLDGLQTPVTNGQLVTIIPAVAGG